MSIPVLKAYPSGRIVYDARAILKSENAQRHLKATRKYVTNMSTEWEFEEDMKKFLGLPPFNGPSNICMNDPYFARELEEKYGRPIAESVDRFLRNYKNGQYLNTDG